jgi:hypothetical protein
MTIREVKHTSLIVIRHPGRRAAPIRDLEMVSRNQIMEYTEITQGGIFLIPLVALFGIPEAAKHLSGILKWCLEIKRRNPRKLPRNN